jgi:hypothetical protein
MKPKLSLFSYEKEEGTSNYTKETRSNLTHRINGKKNDSRSVNLEALSLESMSRCARFDICSAPKCPLDILVNLRIQDETDHRCEMAKATRHKYWLTLPDSIKKELKFQGYFESEYNRMKSARERWESVPDEKKQEILSKLKNASVIATFINSNTLGQEDEGI